MTEQSTNNSHINNMTESELHSLIIEALNKPPDNTDDNSFTSREITSSTGLSYKKVRAILADLMEQDIIETTTKMKKNIAGVWCPRPAYKLKKERQKQHAAQ